MRTSYMIVLLGLFYFVIETIVFRYNIIAKSGDEVICDGIGLIIVSIGFMIAEIEKIKGKK